MAKDNGCFNSLNLDLLKIVSIANHLGLKKLAAYIAAKIGRLCPHTQTRVWFVKYHSTFNAYSVNGNAKTRHI